MHLLSHTLIIGLVTQNHCVLWAVNISSSSGINETQIVLPGNMASGNSRNARYGAIGTHNPGIVVKHSGFAMCFGLRSIHSMNKSGHGTQMFLLYRKFRLFFSAHARHHFNMLL